MRKILSGTIAAGPARVLEAAYFLVSGLLVFVLPYYVPIKYVTYSFSYDYGFNNHVAVAAALFCVLLAPLFLRRDIAQFPASVKADDEPAPRKKLLFWMAGLHTAGITFYFLVTLLNGETPDGSYFLGNAISMALGLRPYRDFEFAYGPGLLYPTHWLNAAGLSVHSSYFLFLLAVTYAGLYMAWRFAKRLPVSTDSKELVFLLIGSISLISLLTTAGANYIIVRFVTPLWVLSELNTAFVKSKPIFTQAVIACLGIVLADLISPEIATVLAVSAALFFAFTCFRDAEGKLSRALATVLCLATHGVILFVLMPPQFRDSMATFSRGGVNFPVVPCVLDTFYLVGTAYCMRRYLSDWPQRNLLLPLILLYGLGSMPAALTHTDCGHVAWDGLAIFVLLIVDSDSTGLPFRRALGLLPAAAYAISIPYTKRLAMTVIVILIPGVRLPRVPASPAMLEKEVAVASSFPSTALVSSADYQLEERLAKVNLRPQYHFDLINVFDPDAVSRVLGDLKRTDPAVLILDTPKVELQCPSEQEETSSLRRWLLYPYSVRRKHNSCEMYAPYFAYLHEQYQPMPGYPDLWIKKALYAEIGH